MAPSESAFSVLIAAGNPLLRVWQAFLLD